jgi:hypothetical protein
VRLKVYPLIKKAFTFLMITITLLSIVGVSFGWDNQTSYTWNFQNYSYLVFNQTENFTYAPSQGEPYDSSLVGHWNMNEGSGTMVHDSSGNGNNGTVVNSTWVAGKFGNALSFNGASGIVNLGNSSSFSSSQSITLSMWIKFDLLAKYGYTLAKTASYMVYASEGGLLHWWVYTTSGNYDMASVGAYADGAWHLTVCTFDSTLSNQQMKIYIDGILSNSHNLNGTIASTSNNLFLGAYEGSWRPFKGALDDVRIYNRALSATEIAALYTLPDPAALANYYNYQDPVTNNTMLIHIDNPNGNSDKIALVTCTNFFEDNRLTFQANNSAIVNIWTNLGQPLFTLGVWNSENYTTTLTLDASSTVEVQWNLGTPPFTSSLSASSTVAGKITVFSALWSDNQSLSSGGYIFSTNNTGEWINASWASFSSNPCWGNDSSTLDSNVGRVVGFREFANNSLNLWGDSGIYAITTINDTSMATPTPTPSNASNASPAPTNSATTSTPTANPTTTPTLHPETNQLLIQTVAIVAIAVAVVVAVFALAFKKGYIIIEVVEEQEGKDQEEN